MVFLILSLFLTSVIITVSLVLKSLRSLVF